MSEVKPFASLEPKLLARKGGARPAMRPQILRLCGHSSRTPLTSSTISAGTTWATMIIRAPKFISLRRCRTQSRGRSADGGFGQAGSSPPAGSIGEPAGEAGTAAALRTGRGPPRGLHAAGGRRTPSQAAPGLHDQESQRAADRNRSARQPAFRHARARIRSPSRSSGRIRPSGRSDSADHASRGI